MNAASAELTAFTGMTGGEVMSAADFAILQRNAEMVAMENMEAFFVKKKGNRSQTEIYFTPRAIRERTLQ